MMAGRIELSCEPLPPLENVERVVDEDTDMYLCDGLKEVTKELDAQNTTEWAPQVSVSIPQLISGSLQLSYMRTSAGCQFADEYIALLGIQIPMQI